MAGEIKHLNARLLHSDADKVILQTVYDRVADNVRYDGL